MPTLYAIEHVLGASDDDPWCGWLVWIARSESSVVDGPWFVPAAQT